MALGAIVVLSLAATGVAALVRAAPWPAAWLTKKPLACVACMAGHASWVVLLAAWWVLGARVTSPAEAVFTWLGMTGAAAVLLAQTGLFVQGFTFEPEPPPVSHEEAHGP